MSKRKRQRRKAQAGSATANKSRLQAKTFASQLGCNAIRILGVLLHRLPRSWGLLRFCLRYGPKGCVTPDSCAEINAHYKARPRSFEVPTRYGFRVAGDTRDLIQRYLFLFGVWEPCLTQWLRQRLKPGDVFVDVGANIGYYSLVSSVLVGASGSVVSIEASPSTFQKLLDNIRLNRLRNIRALNVAASSASSTVRMFRAPANNLGSSSLLEGDGFECEGEVQAAALADLLTADEIRRARIIKIDVEGLEVVVVQGLLPVLAQARHDLEIIVEVGGGPGASAPSASSAAGEIIPLMKAMGFNVYRVANNYSPRYYAEVSSFSRPARLSGGLATLGECDLIFSRKNKKLL